MEHCHSLRQARYTDHRARALSLVSRFPMPYMVVLAANSRWKGYAKTAFSEEER